MTPREQQLTAQLEQCQQALALAQRENLLLRQKVDALARRIFGVSSEALDPAQLQLLLQMPELKPVENPPAPVEKPIVAVRKDRKHRAPRLPENLPVIEEVIGTEPFSSSPHHPPQICSSHPGRCRAGLAPLPDCLQERGLAAPGLLAHVLVSKYCDHLPLYRQEQIFAQRHKINLPRQTLARWVELAADWLKPIYEHLRTGVMAGGYVQVDETPINYLEPGNGKTKQGYFWTGSRPGGDVFFRAWKPAGRLRV